MAMLITTLTTAASFFSNLASAIGVIKEFGFFMGLTVRVATGTSLAPYAAARHRGSIHRAEQRQHQVLLVFLNRRIRSAPNSRELRSSA